MTGRERERPAPDRTGSSVVVHVTETIAPALAGHEGCSYHSPPQPREQALRLVRVLVGPSRRVLDGRKCWDLPVAGGRRSVWLSGASDANSGDGGQ